MQFSNLEGAVHSFSKKRVAEILAIESNGADSQFWSEGRDAIHIFYIRLWHLAECISFNSRKMEEALMKFKLQR